MSSVLRDIMRTIVESTGLIYGLLARKMPATALDLLSGSELEMISFLRSALITPRFWGIGRAGEKEMVVHLLYVILYRTTCGIQKPEGLFLRTHIIFTSQIHHRALAPRPTT